MGSNGSFSGKTNANAQYWVNNGKAPANWQLFSTWTHFCGYPNLYATTHDIWSGDPEYEYQVYLDVQNLGLYNYDCVTYQSNGTPETLPSASTNFAIVGQLPSSISLGAYPDTPFITTYGMPQLYIYDGTPTGGVNLV